MKQQKGPRQDPTAERPPARLVRHASGAVRVSKKESRRADAPVEDVAAATTRTENPTPSTTPTTPATEHERAKAPLRGKSGAHAAIHAAVGAGLARLPVTPASVCGGLVALASLGSHWLVPAGSWHLLVSLTPLLLLLVGRAELQRLQSGIHAGLLWLALAWAELVHPSAGASRPELHQLLALTVLALIFFHLSEASQLMQHLSQRDPLTGLLNRRGFEELSAVELQRAARYERPIAFALLDVDRFKAVNDLYGHATGDRVLRIVSEELLRLRTSDLAVRLGGDEFGLLMPETDALGAEQLVQRLRQRIHARMSEHGWPVTVSAGVASSSVCVRRLSELTAEADRRMYASKSASRC